jgi:hypothetical protein
MLQSGMLATNHFWIGVYQTPENYEIFATYFMIFATYFLCSYALYTEDRLRERGGAHMKAARVFLTTIAVIFLAALLALTGGDADRGVHSSLEQANAVRRTEILVELSRKRYAAVDELLDGRQTLQQTATAFRNIAAEDPGDLHSFLRTCFFDCSEEGLYYRQVQCYVRAQGHTRNIDPAVLKSLEEECEALAREPGRGAGY